MNYDDIFKEDINTNLSYSNYPGNKMIAGSISLEYAAKRLNKSEFYTLVTYKEGDELPEQYVPLKMGNNNDGTLFATINPNLHMDYVCRNGGIQKISLLSKHNGNPLYLLGAGDDTVTLIDLANAEYESYMKQNIIEEKSKTI